MKLTRFKKNSLIQLINCKEKWTVKSIKDLSDGKLFCDIIEDVFPESFEVLKNEGLIIVNYEEQSKSKEFSTNVDSKSENHEMICEDSNCEKTVIEDLKTVQNCDTESAVHDSESALPTSSVESVPEQINSAAQDEEIVAPDKSSVKENVSVSKPENVALNNSASLTELGDDKLSEKDKMLASNRYRLIQYFIDVRYNLKSDTVINFSECWRENELELAKVLIFILSEVVRHYVRLEDPFIQTLSLVDPPVQQDLAQCFNFFINERSKITKADIEKLLTHSSYKVESSPEKSYSTPSRSCSSKYRRISPNLSSDSVFTNSPLKTYFESPVFTKADITSKDKELGKLRELVNKEEFISWSLKEQIETLKRKIEEKNKEINNLKMSNRLLQEIQVPEDCEDCLELKKVIEEHERCIQELKVNGYKRHDELLEYFREKLVNYKIEVAEKLVEFNFEMRQAGKTIAEVEKNLDKALMEKKDLEIKVEELSEKLNDKIKELEVYKEKLCDAEKKVKGEPESSVLGECMGEYFKENENFSFDISHMKLSVPLQEKSVKDVMVQYPEESFMVNNLQPCPNNILSSCNINMCSRSPKKQKPNDCDVSPEIDFQSKQFVNLVPKETSFNDISYQSVSKEKIGSLWLKCNDSDDKNVNNNNFSIKNDEFDSVSQNNNFSPEIKNIDEICHTDNGLTNALSILHKTALYLDDVSNFSATSKVSSVHNGSNGHFSSPVIKEFLETMKKSIQNCVLCLSEAGKSQTKFKNNNSISTQMITDTGGNSDRVYLKCAECLKVRNDNSTNVIVKTENSVVDETATKNQESSTLGENVTKNQENSAPVENTVKNQESYALVDNATKNQESSALVENAIKNQESCPLVENATKNQEGSVLVENAVKNRESSALVENATKNQESSALLEKTQELDKLKIKYMENKKKLFHIENEYKKYRGKYYHLKIEFQERFKMVKEIDLKYQKLQNSLKEAKQREDELEKEWKEAKAVIKLQSKELLENRKMLDISSEAFNKHVEKITDEYAKHRNEFLLKFKQLSLYNKYLEGKLKHIQVTMNLPSTSRETEEIKRFKGIMAEDAMAENTSIDSSEVVSQYTVNESMLNSALQPKRLHNALHIDDEEDIFNHSSLFGIQKDPESEDRKRIQELKRRNSLYPRLLRSSYAVENLIETPIEMNLSECRPDRKDHARKKRKISNMETENQSGEQFSTPVVKTKRKFLQTPTSLKKWCLYSRKQRPGFVRPKP